MKKIIDKRYRIHYVYGTGDSFHHEQREDDLELTWSKLKVAEENLNRINEHYEYYQRSNGDYWKWKWNEKHPTKQEEDKWLEDQKKKPWHVDPPTKYCHDYFSIRLITDAGKECIIRPPWIGYFESLISAEIIQELPRIEF